MSKQIRCTGFTCGNLTNYSDSMLFDSGESIATGTFECDGETLDIDLEVAGDVRVEFKGETYRKPSEFPDELRDRIRANPNNWDITAPSGEDNDEPESDVYVCNNNWFEYVFNDDGEVFEDDLSKVSPERILRDMRAIADQYFGVEAEANRQTDAVKVNDVDLIRAMLDNGILRFTPCIFMQEEISGSLTASELLTISDTDAWTANPKQAVAEAVAARLRNSNVGIKTICVAENDVNGCGDSAYGYVETCVATDNATLAKIEQAFSRALEDVKNDYCRQSPDERDHADTDTMVSDAVDMYNTNPIDGVLLRNASCPFDTVVEF